MTRDEAIRLAEEVRGTAVILATGEGNEAAQIIHEMNLDKLVDRFLREQPAPDVQALPAPTCDPDPDEVRRALVWTEDPNWDWNSAIYTLMSAASAYLRMREQQPMQATDKLAGNSDVQAQIEPTGLCGSCFHPESDHTAWMGCADCGCKVLPVQGKTVTKALIAELRVHAKFYEARGSADEKSVDTVFCCLPVLLDEVENAQAQIDALKAENDHWRETAKDRISAALADQMIQEAVAREREACAEVADAEATRLSAWPTNRHQMWTAQGIAKEIRARSGKGE